MRRLPPGEPTFIERHLGSRRRHGRRLQQLLARSGRARHRASTASRAARSSSIRPMAACRRSRRKRGSARRSAAPRNKKFGEFDHPELRGLAERCLLSFGSNAGPPMLPNYFYNNNYQIVQTKDHVMIMTEMVHDARIIRMGGDASAEAACASGWAIRSAAGKATRWSSRRPTSIRCSSVPRRVGEPQGHRALHAHRSGHDRLQVHDRRSDDVHGAVERRAAVQPDRRA